MRIFLAIFNPKIRLHVTKTIWITIAISINICLITNAQQILKFRSITVQEGLPSNYVLDLMEDNDGYFWIGTDKGMAKFDGFRWQTINTGNGLPGNYVRMIKPAGRNGLWLEIGTKGIFYYDKTNGACTYVTTNYVHDFFQTDEKDNLFFYQHENTLKGQLNAGWISPDNPTKINHAFSYINRVPGLYVCADFNRRLLHILKPAHFKSTEIEKFNIITIWNSDTIQVSDCSRTVNKFVDEHIFSDAGTLVFHKNGNEIFKIKLFDTSNIYLNTQRWKNQFFVWNGVNGLFLVNDRGKITHWGVEQGLAGNRVTDVCVLKNGRILVSTLGGGISCVLKEGIQLIGIKGSPLKGLAHEKDIVFAATDNLLFKYDYSTQHTEIFPISEKQVQNVDIYDGKIYISSLAGFSEYEIVHSSLEKKREFFVGSGICNVIKKDSLLIAGTFGKNVMKLFGNVLVSDESTPMVSEKIQLLSNGFVSSNYEDGLQFTFNNGKKLTLTEKAGLPSNAVYHVHEFRDTFWICTQKGVAVFDGKNILNVIDNEDGLTGNRCIFSFHDKQGNLWILTDLNLCKYAGKQLITNMSLPIREGNLDFIQKAVYMSEQNVLVAGSQKIVSLTILDSVDCNPYVEIPSLQRVLFENNEIRDTIFSLPLNYRSLSFEFYPLLANPFGRSKILYKLMGYNENFVELKDSLNIHFGKLRSGNYTLIAKTVSEEGIKSGEVILSKFTIKKPFIQSGWFILICIILSGLIAHLIATYYQKLKIKQKEKELKIERKLSHERERISRELHDNFGSSLASIIAQSDYIETSLLNNRHSAALSKIQVLSSQTRETMNILRHTIWTVQEKSHSYENFMYRVRDYLQRTYDLTKIEFCCQASGKLSKDLSPEQTLNLFRCIQESTQNIIRHSGASFVQYLFSAENHIFKIEIKDNGKGFDTENNYPGFGLKNILNRINDLNGKAIIRSTLNKGTSVIIEIEL